MELSSVPTRMSLRLVALSLYCYCSLAGAADAESVPNIAPPTYASSDYKIGLALSGGGVRSGMFTIGVLSALEENGILPNVDVISSVSGGGYAAYWYMNHRAQGIQGSDLFADCTPLWWGDNDTLRRLLDKAPDPKCLHNKHWTAGDPYRHQYYLAQNADIFDDSPSEIDGGVQENPAAKIFSSFIGGLFSNKKSLGTAYENGIYRAYGLTPSPRQFATYGPWSYNRTGTEAAARVSGWNALANKVPDTEWLVSVTTNGISEDKKNDIFRSMEIGTLGWGNEIAGYNSGEIPKLPVAKSVRLSGAVVDRNASPDSVPGGALVHALMPLSGIEFGEKVLLGTSPKVEYRLSDGGMSENLGLLPLIKRRVPQIISVDAGYDRDGDLDDLCRLRKNLRGLADISLETINISAICDQGKAINVFELQNRVHVGAIVMADGTELELFYIKLGWNEQMMREAYNQSASDIRADPAMCGADKKPSCLLVAFYGHNTEIRSTRDGYLVFPQYETFPSTANSSTYIFWGLRELGKYLGDGINLVDGVLTAETSQGSEKLLPHRDLMTQVHSYTTE